MCYGFLRTKIKNKKTIKGVKNMVSKNLLADYGQASVELEFAQERYNRIRAEIVKQIQFDQEQAQIASQKEEEQSNKQPTDNVVEELKKIDEAIENNK